MATPSEKRDVVGSAVELEKEENEDEDNSDLYDELVESDGSDTDESIYGVCVKSLLKFFDTKQSFNWTFCAQC